MAGAALEIARANRGEGCLGKSAPDEPVFVLCGRDLLAGDTVRFWADALEVRAVGLGELDAGRKAKIAEARALALQMDSWGKRLPD